MILKRGSSGADVKNMQEYSKEGETLWLGN